MELLLSAALIAAVEVIWFNAVKTNRCLVLREIVFNFIEFNPFEQLSEHFCGFEIATQLKKRWSFLQPQTRLWFRAFQLHSSFRFKLCDSSDYFHSCMRIIQQKIREIQRNWNSQKSSFISHKRDAFTLNWLIRLSHQQEHHRDKTRTFLLQCLAQWHACALQEHAFTVFDPKVSARMTCNRQWFMGCSKNQRHYYLCVTFFPPFICSCLYIFVVVVRFVSSSTLLFIFVIALYGFDWV